MPKKNSKEQRTSLPKPAMVPPSPSLLPLHPPFRRSSGGAHGHLGGHGARASPGRCDQARLAPRTPRGVENERRGGVSVFDQRSPAIWLKALLYHSNTHDCVTKEPLQAAYRIIQQYNPPGTIHPPIIHIGILDSLRNRSRDHINDLYYHRAPVPFWDRYPRQWATGAGGAGEGGEGGAAGGESGRCYFAEMGQTSRKLWKQMAGLEVWRSWEL